jgi:hypothetical protein
MKRTDDPCWPDTNDNPLSARRDPRDRRATKPWRARRRLAWPVCLMLVAAGVAGSDRALASFWGDLAGLAKAFFLPIVLPAAYLNGSPSTPSGRSSRPDTW